VTDLGRRIVVVGSGGKTTLAAELAGRLGLRHIELDALFWEPNWQHPPDEVFRQRVADTTDGDGWAADGNYTRVVRDLLWPRAQTIVWLDYPLAVVVHRVLSRSWRRWRRNELLWGTNRERFWPHLKLWDAESSLIAYAAASHRRRRRDYEAAMTNPRWSHVTFVRHRSPRQTERWLAESFAAVD
jgi:adenylate kinase family enzyme